MSFSKPSIELNLVKTGSTVVGGINIAALNKPELLYIATALKNYLEDARLTFSRESDRALVTRYKGIFNYTFPLSSAKKDDIVSFLTAFASDFSNIVNTARAVAPRFLVIWNELIHGTGLNLEYVSDTVGKKIPIVKDTGWRGIYLSDPLLFGAYIYKAEFSWRVNDPSEFTAYVPQIQREKFARKLLGPDALNPVTLPQLPDSHLPVENYESVIPSDIFFLNEIDSSTKLLGSNDSFPAARLKSVVKAFDTGEFRYSPGGIPISRPGLIATAYISMLLYCREHPQYKPQKEIADIARFLTGKLPDSLCGAAFASFLPYYKGFTKGLSYHSRAAMIVPQILRLLEPARDKWLNLSNFDLRYLCGDRLISSSSSFTGLFEPHNFSRANIKRSDIATVGNATYFPADEPDLWDDITRPFIHAYIRLLVAFGLIESTVVPAAHGSGAATYIRMTPLGRYAFGFEQDYTPAPVADAGPVLDFDDRNMIITLLDPKAPVRFLLDQTAQKIGGARYRLTPVDLISRCKDKEELISRICSLRKILPQPKDNPWQQILDQAKLRSETWLPDHTRYMIIKLNPECPGLLQFINDNPEIRKNILRADGANILIPADFHDHFLKLARAAGYLF